MFKFYIFIAIIYVSNYLLTKFIRQKYNIIDPRRIRYVNGTHKWVEISLVVLAVIVFVLFLFKLNLVWLTLFIAISIFGKIIRAIFEYKYEREEKEFIITLVDLGIWCVFSGTLLVYYINTIN
ncbi:DUF4181 domain-containing protein [Sporosarcina sp. ITBMC105]